MPDMARLGDPAQTSSRCWKMDRNDPAPRLGNGPHRAGGRQRQCRVFVVEPRDPNGAALEPWMLVSPATRGSCCRRKHNRGPTAGASRRFFPAKAGYEVIIESRRGQFAVAACDDYGLCPTCVRRSTHTSCRRPRSAAHARTTVGQCPDKKTHGTEAFLNFCS
jgi:hypothetical protein